MNSSARSTPLTDSDDSDNRDDDGTEDERFCEAEEWDGLKFPRTAACQEARLPCPRPEITVGKILHKAFREYFCRRLFFVE
ncbi:unnamed protein product [Anisakis simplex]|uniref:Uncharacterized protein n=1 Tax=Anisakis simplex TaxID=6269 RepID=A0A0M3JJP1_ANISI|nr:unnamed protein product [Anisakis simplex]